MNRPRFQWFNNAPIEGRASIVKVARWVNASLFRYSMAADGYSLERYSSLWRWTALFMPQAVLPAQLFTYR
jgi:hypothetical protein